MIYALLAVTFAYYLLQEIVCSSPPAHPTFDSNVTGPATAETIAQLKCIPSLRFDDGYRTKSLVCLNDGSWSETNLSCQGRCRSNVLQRHQENLKSCMVFVIVYNDISDKVHREIESKIVESYVAS